MTDRKGPAGSFRRVAAVAGVVALVLAACSSGSESKSESTSSSATRASTGTKAASGTGTKPKHVAIVMLENKSFDQTWGPTSPAKYLTTTLRPQGKLLAQFFGIAHVSLGNYIAQISGQAPSKSTQGDCVIYKDFVATGMGPDGQILGDGCVYPTQVKTIADQLAAKGLTWRAYAEDMAAGAPAQPTTCRHGTIGQADPSLVATATDQYATRHVPFVYFHSIIDSPTCNENVVDLNRLDADLADASKTPNLVYITPDLCSDAHDGPCKDGRPGGLTSADAFLKTWIPKLRAAPAFKSDGLVIITFDEAEISGPDEDASACCGPIVAPNVAEPGAKGPGGGRVGALLLGASVKPGTTSAVPYNHYALLCSLEDLWGLDHLGLAGQPGLRCFGPDVYDAGG